MSGYFLNKIFGDITLVFNRKEEFAGNRLHILWFAIFANVTAMFYGGNFFTGLLLRMGASDAYMGTITIVTYAGNIAALFSPLIIERFIKRKKMILITRAIYYALLLGFITLIPYLGAGTGVKLALVLSAITVVNLISALTGSGMSVWHMQSIPQSIRSSFFTNINMIIGILNMVALNLAGLFADYFKSQGQEMLGITLLRLMACVFACADIYNLSRLREYHYPKADVQLSLIAIFKNPIQNKRYRAVMAVILIWTLTATLPGPFYQVYLLKDLQISYSFLSAVNLLNIPVLLIALPIWNRVIRSVGDIKLFSPLAGLMALHFVALALVNRGNYQWLYPVAVFYNFVLVAGITQVASLMPYKFIPDTNQSNYFSFYSTVTMVAALLGTILGQQFIVLTESANITLLGIQIANKQLLVLVTGIAVFGGSIAILFINKWLEKTGLNKETDG